MKNPFRNPTPIDFAEQTLARTRMEIQEASLMAEQWYAHVHMLSGRAARLELYLGEQKAQETIARAKQTVL